MTPLATKVDRTQPPLEGNLRPFSFPPFERHRLSNGLRLLAARRPGLPLMSFELITPGGGLHDPPGQAGLSSFTSGMLDEGTARRGSLEIASTVERLGGALGTGIDWDGAYLAAGVLATHRREALELLVEVATEPSFPEAELERLRGQRLTEIMRRSQVPSIQADHCLQLNLYEGTPYAWPLIGTRATVEALDHSAITSHYRRFYGMAGATLIAVGDFEPQRLLVELEEVLGAAPPQPGTGAPLPVLVPKPLAERRIFLVDRPGAAQTELAIGHSGVSRAHPEYAKLAVLNSILGGKFTSRINLNLRERNGFTYSANSRFYGRKGPGPFTVASAVSTESAGAAAREILFELQRIREEMVSERELDEARSYVAGVFPYTCQTLGDLTKRLETLALFGFPDDYFDRYLKQILTVTREDLLAAAQEFITPDRCAVVAVGPASELLPQLEGLGPIVRWTAPE